MEKLKTEIFAAFVENDNGRILVVIPMNVLEAKREKPVDVKHLVSLTKRLTSYKWFGEVLFY